MVLDAGVWTDEHQRWRPDLDLTQVSYSSLCGRERTERGGWRPTESPRPEYRRPWDTVIFDESHYLKGRKTLWTKAAGRLKTGKFMLATGTPIPNWAHELFTTCQFVYPEEAKPGGRFGSYWRWARQWFDVGPTHWSPMDIGKPLDDSPDGWLRFYEANLGDRFLQRLRDDVLTDLPPLTEQTMRVPMTPAQARVYKRLKKEFIAWVEETGHEIVAWNSAALTVKLAKVCTGLGVEDPTATKLESGKLAALRDLLADRAQPTLVVAHFKASVAAAVALGGSLGLHTAQVTGDSTKGQRRAVIQDFQAGRLDLLVGSLDVIAEGLTLTRADMVIFLEHSWRPSRNEQAMRRIHRIGQTRPVTAVHLVSADSIDDRIQTVLARKTDQQVKALRARELAALI